MVHPKVAAGGFAGAAVVAVVAILGAFGITVPDEVASAVTVLISFGASYLKKAPTTPSA